MNANFSALNALLQASWIVQLTFLIMIFLSIGAWAIAIQKWRYFQKLQSTNENFLQVFYKSKSLESIYDEVKSYADSSAARVFGSGYVEYKRSLESQSLLAHENLESSLRKAIDLEINTMESKLSWLATTGSTAPFIGLFGTVWGIMASFHKIGATGSASLAVVAPGISEALLSTAVGLAAAIPSVALYNHFISKLKKQEMELNSLATDFVNLSKRLTRG